MKRIICSLILVSGCRNSEAAPAEPAAPPLHVESVLVREVPMPLRITMTGSLRGARQTDLAANGSGRVVEVLVDRGADVASGAIIARLDVRSAALAASEARANARSAAHSADAADTECSRGKGLFEKGALSKQELERIQAQCRTSSDSREAAEARATLAAKNVGDGIIRAPFAGLVTERFVNVGEFLHEDSKVVALASIDALRLQATLPESRFALMGAGRRVTFSVAAYPDRLFSGTTRAATGAVREATRDFVVEADVPNPDRLLRPGMFARAFLDGSERPTAVVPQKAIVRRADAAHVFVIVDGRAEERVVLADSERGDDVAITRGVRSGETVIVSPPAALRNGQAVN